MALDRCDSESAEGRMPGERWFYPTSEELDKNGGRCEGKDNLFR